MGTAAHEPELVAVTNFIRGGEKIEVDLLTGPPVTWARDLFIFATETWGGTNDRGLDKWVRSTVDARKRVVLAVLMRKALPLALELPTFLFEVRNCSRVAFDQLARARVGVTFSSQGTRDNAHPDIDVIVPPRIWDNPSERAMFMEYARHAKEGYVNRLRSGMASWQDARYLLPQGIVHRFAVNLNYAALSNLLGKRLMFCEEHVTVATAWKLRKAVWDAGYSLLAVPLRPSCDFARRCTYRDHDQVGELFSNLFSGCGRWPDPLPIGEFNYAAADKEDIEAWLGEAVPDGQAPIAWEEAASRDEQQGFFDTYPQNSKAISAR
jgi:thymidylate synthase ThyX